MIPTLKTAFCGCSNRTGCKIIGWITLVGLVFELIMIVAPLALLKSHLSDSSDQEIGTYIINLKKHIQSGEKTQEGRKQFDDNFIELLNISTDKKNPAEIGKGFKEMMEGLLPIIGIALLTVFLFSILITILMLYGVYKNKAGYILFYLVLCVLGSVGFIPLIFSSGVSFNATSFIIISSFLVHLYFTWVVYSFYQELHGTVNQNIGLNIMAPTGQMLS